VRHPKPLMTMRSGRGVREEKKPTP